MTADSGQRGACVSLSPDTGCAWVTVCVRAFRAPESYVRAGTFSRFAPSRRCVVSSGIRRKCVCINTPEDLGAVRGWRLPRNPDRRCYCCCYYCYFRCRRCDFICGSGHGEVRNCHDHKIFFPEPTSSLRHPRDNERLALLLIDEFSLSPRHVRGKGKERASFNFSAPRNLFLARHSRVQRAFRGARLFFPPFFSFLLIINEATCSPDKCASQ